MRSVMMLALCCSFAMGLAPCSKSDRSKSDRSKSDRSKSDRSKSDRSKSDDKKPTKSEEDAKIDDGQGACVAACVTDRQMEAKGAEAIEADCREKCARNPRAYP